MSEQINNPVFFSIFPEFQENYYKNIDNGKKFIEDKKIVVAGLTRNNGPKLYKNIKLLDSLKKDISYFIYENDSTDNTVSVLKQLSKENANFNYKSETLNLVQYGQVKDKERTERLAHCRNICLDHIKNYHADSDYVIVLDLDYIALSIDGLFHSFGIFSNTNNVNAIAGFSYQIKRNSILWNYDSWAFRWTWWDDLQKHNMHYTIDPMGWFGLYYPPIGSNPIFVNSAFGGSCIYQTASFIKGQYSGEDCEHVMFHKFLYDKTNFGLVANPSQVMIL